MSEENCGRFFSLPQLPFFFNSSFLPLLGSIYVYPFLDSISLRKNNECFPFNDVKMTACPELYPSCNHTSQIRADEYRIKESECVK